MQKQFFEIKPKQTLERDELVDLLFSYNYAKDDEVSRPGEFCVRGSVLDIFPFNFRSPVRITFDLDQVESIRGFAIEDGSSLSSHNKLIILPVHEFFEKRLAMYEAGSRDSFDAFFKISKGDIVVHANYGIGKYLGARMLKTQGEKKKFFAIEYANNEVLYVEGEGPRLVERYVGCEGRKPKLSTLRTKDWQRVKARTRLAVKNIAKEMIYLQAQRNQLRGIKFDTDTEWQQEFEDEFPYEETPDQVRATLEVKKDMESKKPMDRLLCGDVGYGKTEVAMRAAFKAIMGNKQVAMLVPTTILAEQHYLSFKDRVKSFPVRVEVLSRFKTRSEQKEIVAQLKDGAVDIVIGTHRLLSKDIAFKDLGLVIIDEEQRFGVHHKEKLKHYRALVDVLTLTATPIPRTLYMSLMGVRDISMITTPPKSRLPVHTEVLEYNDLIVKQAIEHELARKGQVYFVHNRVQSIERIHKHLKELLPDIRLGVAHGQMKPSELEPQMIKFFKGNIDVLIATSIIETGLDVPNVNTIIINRADMFGLSDLYQLRGRVGRLSSKRKAYAYLMVPSGGIVTQDSWKRLQAIEKYTELGSGFKIAMEDLELRGAGNLLGSEQSGFINQVGFDMYCRLLEEAINAENTSKNS